MVASALVILGVLAWGLVSSDLLQSSQGLGNLWGAKDRSESQVSDDPEVGHALACFAPENGYHFVATCAARGNLGGDEIKISSAAREDDRGAGVDRPRESGLAVFNLSEHSGPMWFPAPLPGGPPYIDSVEGDVLRLARSHGSVFFFDVSRLTYTKTLEPYTQMDFEEGIRPNPGAMPNMIVANFWRKVIGGEWVTVEAGATMGYREDQSETVGTAGLWLWHQTKGRQEWHPAPGSPRAVLRTESARGHVLTLVSSDGTVLHFDVDKETYV
jgi:hypothetical protein